MRVIILQVLLVLFSGSFAQELFTSHTNEVDALGRRQGKWIVFDGNGNIKFEGVFKDGVPTGEFTHYYPKGMKKATIYYRDGEKDVFMISFFENGKVMAEGKYVDQKKDSTWKFYSEITGTIVSLETYENTIKSGVWQTYYENGKVLEEITYKDDIREGSCNQYFTNGEIKSKSIYINDRLEGLTTIYHLNGKVNVSGTYKNSQKDGIWMYFNEIGEKEMKEVYSNGDLLTVEEFGR